MGAAVRAFIRRPEPIPGAAELHVGGMIVAGDWRRALRGVDAVYHICPNMHPQEVPMARPALAAATAIVEPGHEEAIYELVGMAGPSQKQVAQILGQVAVHPVRARQIPPERWAAQAAGLTDAARHTLLAMFRYYARHDMTGNPNVLSWLLGRAPTGLAEVAQRWSK